MPRLEGRQTAELGTGREDAVETEPSQGQDPGVTFRSVGFGLCMSVAVGILANTVRFVQHGSYMSFCHMPMSNLVLFVLSILTSAVLARWFGRRFVFSRTEWITVFSMGFVGAFGPTYGVSGYVVGLLASPYYFASPENRWADFIHPHLPGWLIPTDEGGAMTWFWEGLPVGASIPWKVWLGPTLWWFTLVWAVGLACACLSAIIHRQWADKEKLVYPAIVPIAEIMGQAGTGRRLLPEFMRGKAFWAGFSIIAFIFSWNMIPWFHPQFPVIPVGKWQFLFYSRYYPPLFINLSTFVMFFSYFASLEVLFSIWFFDLVFTFEGGALNRLGLGATSPHYAFGSFKYQTTGAFVTLVLWWCWISRQHFRDAFQKALHPDPSSVDDSRELLSYRAAFIGLAVSCLYIAGWLLSLGVEGRVVLLVIPAMLVVFLGVSKIVVDSGLVYTNPPASAWDLTTAALGGSKALQVSTNAALGMGWFPISHMRGLLTMPMAHVNRLGDLIPSGKRRLFWAVCAAFVLGTVASTFYNIWLGYVVGGYNFRPNWLIIGMGPWQYQKAVTEILSPTPLEPADFWFFLVGAGLMVILNVLRYRFTWWPFHPVGLALSGMSLTRLTSATIFLAWALKYLLIRVAGAAFYRRSKPFFVGMLIAYVLAVAAGILVDSIWFPNQGHKVHQWY